MEEDPSLLHKTAMVSDIVVPSLTIDSNLLFDAGQISFRPTAQEHLQRVAAFVEQYRPNRLVIIGHTDETEDEEAGQALSQSQAETARLYLIETIPSVTPAMAEARGVGSRTPVAANDTPENRARNRRIEVIAWD